MARSRRGRNGGVTGSLSATGGCHRPTEAATRCAAIALSWGGSLLAKGVAEPLDRNQGTETQMKAQGPALNRYSRSACGAILVAVSTLGCSEDIWDVGVQLAPEMFMVDFGSTAATIPTVTCDLQTPTICGGSQVVEFTGGQWGGHHHLGLRRRNGALLRPGGRARDVYGGRPPGRRLHEQGRTQRRCRWYAWWTSPSPSP